MYLKMSNKISLWGAYQYPICYWKRENVYVARVNNDAVEGVGKNDRQTVSVKNRKHSLKKNIQLKSRNKKTNKT